MPDAGHVSEIMLWPIKSGKNACRSTTAFIQYAGIQIAG